MPRLGLLGGTFNPPHLGHLVCAHEAADQLGLERVLLVPVAEPPHKQVRDDPGPEARLELCRAAVEGDERLGVSAIEVERGGASFTVDTLRELHAEGAGDDLTFIVGGDMALSLPRWREPQEVLRLARLAVAERADARRADIEERLASLGAQGRIDFFDMPRIDLSSSDVRARVRAGRSVRHLVPAGVAERIAGAGWYRL